MTSIIFITLAAIFNAVMDTLSFRYNTSIFSNYPQWKQYLDPSVSWENKYKNGDPTQGPRFFGSETFLVFLTDGWHLAKTLMILCFSSAAVAYTPLLGSWCDVLLFYTLFGTVFQIFFGNIFIK
tara:strand:- start:42 stop:413 length:372 start_codon:yes stop_codon:yes gene_type:complete